MIRIQFNLPDSKEFTETLVVSKNDSLRQVKEKISAVIDIPVDEFRTARSVRARSSCSCCLMLLARCASRNARSQQFKNDKLTMDELKLVDMSGIYISRGRPLRADEINVRFFLYEYGNSGRPKFTQLFDLPVFESIHMTVRTLVCIISDMLTRGSLGTAHSATWLPGEAETCAGWLLVCAWHNARFAPQRMAKVATGSASSTCGCAPRSCKCRTPSSSTVARSSRTCHPMRPPSLMMTSAHSTARCRVI